MSHPFNSACFKSQAAPKMRHQSLRRLVQSFSTNTRWTWRDVTFCPCGTAVLDESGVPRKSSSYGNKPLDWVGRRKKHSTLGQRCHFLFSTWIQALASCSFVYELYWNCNVLFRDMNWNKSLEIWMPKPPQDVESNMSQRTWRRSSQSSSLSSARTSSICSSSSTQQRVWHNRAKLWKYALPITK